MKHYTIGFLILCAWFYVFQMTPIQDWSFLQSEGIAFCGTKSPNDRQINRGYTEAQMRGKLAFEANCARCHNTSLDKKSTGPGLIGVSSRIPQGDWIYRWIQNSSKLIQEGDPYAKKIWEENAKANMDPFPNLPKETIDDIMAWIDSY